MNFIYGKATTQITTAFDRIHLIIFALLWIACSSPFYGSIFGFIFSLRWADNWLMFDLNHFMCANASILLSGIIAIYMPWRRYWDNHRGNSYYDGAPQFCVRVCERERRKELVSGLSNHWSDSIMSKCTVVSSYSALSLLWLLLLLLSLYQRRSLSSVPRSR